MGDRWQLDRVGDALIDLAVRYGPRVGMALAILIVGVSAMRWAGRLTARQMMRLKLEPPVRQLLTRTVEVAVFALFAIMALQNLGIELLPLIAGLGVAGAGIALAMQGVLSNVAAGLTIIFTRPFKVGEYIGIAGVEGRVETISLFDTVLSHADRSAIVIPNRKIVGEILHNYGTVRQLEVVVGVSYETDVAQALASLRDVLDSNPRVLKDPPAAIQVALLADSSIDLAVKPWVPVLEYGAAQGEINAAILEAFRRLGIDISSPRRDIRLVGGSQAAVDPRIVNAR